MGHARARKTSVGVSLAGLLAATLTGASWVTTAGSAQAAATYTQLVSSSATRTNPVPLEGAVLKGSEYVFADPATGVKSVSWYLDDPNRLQPAVHTEGTAPYDYAGGPPAAALPWDTTKLPDGTHSITQVVTPISGTAEVLTSTFTIANSTATPTPTPTPTPTVTPTPTPTPTRHQPPLPLPPPRRP